MTRRSEMLLKNMEFIGYDPLNKQPGFQMAMQKAADKYYLYTASYRANGWNILDVTEPHKPRNIKWTEGPWIDESIHDGQSTPKIQIADGLMLTAHGPNMQLLHGNKGDEPAFCGLMIWDVEADPENPRFLSKLEFPGGGIHRFFYNGGDYAYLTATEPGFNMFILQIVDLHDPENPAVVGKWAAEGQRLDPNAGPMDPVQAIQMPMVHACTVKGDVCYLAAPNYGFTLLDVSDKTNPTVISRLSINPPFGGGLQGTATHTAMPLGDRPYGIVTTEGERPTNYSSKYGAFGLGIPINTIAMNIIGMVELTDMKHPNLIAICPPPQPPEGYTHGTNFNFVDGVRVAFGPHNMFDAFGPDVYEKRSDRVYNAYFQAGLRVYDVSDPFIPKEIAYFLPPDPMERLIAPNSDRIAAGPLVAITEDVLVDDRGYIYVDTFNDGLYIVKCTV